MTASPPLIAARYVKFMKNLDACLLQRVTLDTVLEKYNFDFPFHPEVLKLGLRYADGSIKGANARCIAMLDMLRQVVEDYTTPAGMLLSFLS